MKIVTSLLISLGASATMAQTTYLAEHFDYPSGDSLTNHGWYAHSAAATNPILVGSPGLSWLGYQGSGIGNAALVNNTGQDINKPFSDNITSGSAYASFLVKINAPSPTDGNSFFFHFGNYTNNQTPEADFSNVSTAFRARTFLLAGTDPDTQVKLGLAFNNASTPSGETEDLQIGETYLVVVKYEFIDGDNNDEVSLYLFNQGADISEEPATPTLGPFTFTGTSAADAPALQTVVLRQYNSTQNITVDGIIVKDAWDIEACMPTTGTDTRTECAGYTWIDGNTYDESNNTATFNIVGGAVDGCDSLVTLNLTIVNVETGVTVGGNTLIASATNATYQWLDCDNNNAPIDGATQDYFFPEKSGNYAVEITQNDCTDTSDCTPITLIGIEEELDETAFSIYPNPNQGSFVVSWTNSENKSIRIMNALGQEVFTTQTVGTIADFNLNVLSGVYFIEVSNEIQQVQRQRIVVE